VTVATHELSAARAAEFGLLLQLTEALKAKLEGADWGAAAELELERRRIVERVFETAPAAAELPLLTATLREVVRLNDELIGLAEHRRRAIARELDLLAVGRDAQRAYDDVRRAQHGGRRT
jgi:hypothetical protein